MAIVSRAGDPFLRETIASRRTAPLGSPPISSCSVRRVELMTPGLSRRAAAGRALVLEPALEQLELLPVAELPDRAVRHRTHAVVGVASSALDLVFPRAPQIRQLALVARVGELLRPSRRFRQIEISIHDGA